LTFFGTTVRPDGCPHSAAVGAVTSSWCYQRGTASYEDQVTVEQAASDLQQSCMKDYGIDLTLPRAGANPPPSDNDANIERRYGITDRAEAEKYGYELHRGISEVVGDLIGSADTAPGQRPAVMGGPLAVEVLDHRQLDCSPVIDTRALGTVAARTLLPCLIRRLREEVVDTAKARYLLRLRDGEHVADGGCSSRAWQIRETSDLEMPLSPPRALTRSSTLRVETPCTYASMMTA
jgi:hypothetical protein